MKCKDFNKLGGTEFRTQSQVEGFTQIIDFLLSNEIENVEQNELDKRFKKYVEYEQIYSYKNDKKIKNRLNMVLKIFKQLDLIKQEKGNIHILKDKLEEIKNNPNECFFNLIYNKIIFLKKE